MKNYLGIFKIIFWGLLISCTKTVYITEGTRVVDGQYDSEFPNLPTTDYLHEVNKSIKIINTMSSYKGYEFPLIGGLIESELSDSLIKERALNEIYVNNPASGTATIIYHDNSKIALLTCAHIVMSPDTIVTYLSNKNGDKTPFVQSVYYKVRQNLTISGLPEVKGFEIIAVDEKSDIAVVGKNYKKVQRLTNNVFQFPKGKAEELKAGTFVYLFGFPRGERMVSSALVGRANRNRNHDFILDAPMHKGISGGLVLALRDGVPNFELVGMVFAVAGERISFLGPAQNQEPIKDELQRLYTGDVYLNSVRQIIYGITYAISIEQISSFFEKNKEVFRGKGFDSERFLNGTKPISEKDGK
jgi:predicted RecA/RadA family phage recombinase